MPGARHSIPILLWLALGTALGAAVAAGARAEIPPGLVAAETERVVEIVDGDTLILAGGRQVRLVGIQESINSIVAISLRFYNMLDI